VLIRSESGGSPCKEVLSRYLDVLRSAVISSYCNIEPEYAVKCFERACDLWKKHSDVG
jgi:hypothetical protein